MKPTDFVEWQEHGQTLKGQIISFADGEVKVRSYARTNDGGWEPTNSVATLRRAALGVIAPLFEMVKITQPTRTEGARARKGMVERRFVKCEVRDFVAPTDTSPATAWILVNDYQLTDTYGTRFAKGGCAAYLNANKNRPTFLYGHGTQGGITSVLGHGIGWRESAAGLEINVQMSNFARVPAAEQAWEQLHDGTFDSFSIGFVRNAEKYIEDGDYVLITDYDLPEFSIVIEASNSGTKLLSLSGARMTQEKRAEELLVEVSQGGDLTSAITEMRTLFTRDPADGDGDDDGMVDCPTCDGTGKINADTTKCPDCGGSGEVTQAKSDEIEDRTSSIETEMIGNDEWRLWTPEQRTAYIEYRAKYTSAQLATMLKNGQAMPNADGDPSFPIADGEDLDNAIQAVGLGNKDGDAIRRYIIGRAKALSLESKIPDTWNADGSLKTAGGRSLDDDTLEMLAELDEIA